MDNDMTVTGNQNIEEKDNIEGNIVKIKIFGVGGGGCNAVSRLIDAKIDAVEFIAGNTDMMSLNGISAHKKIQLGAKLTHGLGAGSKPDIGEMAAQESEDLIRNAIKGANLLFVTAGMGGGTGTGAAPVIAAIAKELGILTIAVVTKPFEYEGRKKMLVAEDGINKLQKEADVLVVIPNEKAFDYMPKNANLMTVVQVADSVLHNSIIGITDIVMRPALINRDFADLETVLKNKGTAHIGIGKAKGENRVLEAIRQAATSPLLESNIEGAVQIIVSIRGDNNIVAEKVREACNMIASVVAPEANIMYGVGFDADLKDEAIVTIIATGFENHGPAVTEPREEKPTTDNFLKRAPVAKPTETTETKPAQTSEEGIPDFLQRLKQRTNR